MKKLSTPKLAAAGILCALAVAGSLISIPVFGSKCAPVQHMINILGAVFLGPGYCIGIAFCASLIRNLLGIGSLMAFPGSMLGALLAGVVYRRVKNISAALLAEMFGTAVLGGLCAYPLAIFLMGVNAAGLAFYVYIVPFLISSAAGSALSGLLVCSLERGGALKRIHQWLER